MQAYLILLMLMILRLGFSLPVEDFELTLPQRDISLTQLKSNKRQWRSLPLLSILPAIGIGAFTILGMRSIWVDSSTASQTKDQENADIWNALLTLHNSVLNVRTHLDDTISAIENRISFTEQQIGEMTAKMNECQSSLRLLRRNEQRIVRSMRKLFQKLNSKN